MMASKSALFPQFYNPSTLSTTYSSQSQPTYYLPQISTTERVIVLSSIRMILGYASSIYKYNEEQGFQLSDMMNLKHLTPKALTNITHLLIQYSNRLQYVKTKIGQLRNNPSVVLKQLLDGIEGYLKEIVRYFSQLNVIAEFQAGKINRRDIQSNMDFEQAITLIKLNTIVESKMEVLNIVVGLVSTIIRKSKKANNFSLLVLDTLWELFGRFQSSELKAEISQLILKLSIQPIKKYMQMILRWLTEVTYTSNEDNRQFFVNKNNEEYIICKQQIPEMFKDTAQNILSFGKFIKIIYCFSNEEDKMNINQFMNIKPEFSKLFKFFDTFILQKEIKRPIKQQKRKILSISSMLKEQSSKVARISHQQKQLPYDLHISIKGVFEINRLPQPQKQLPYLQQQRVIIDMTSLFLSEFKMRFQIYFNSVLTSIRQKCSQYFNFKQPVYPFNKIPEHINNHLFCIRSFILFEQGDFIQELIETIGEQLEKPVELIQQNLISDLIQITLLNSNAKFLSPDLLKNVRFRFISKQSECSGWDMFYLQYKLQSPFDHLFPKEVMNRYNIVFNFIWRLKHIQYLLKLVSYGNKGTNQTKTYYIFRNALNLFSNNILSDIFYRVKDEWDKFMTDLYKVESFEEFIDLHKRLISALETITFINSKERQVHLRLENITQIVIQLKEIQQDNIQIDERDKQRAIENLSEQFKFRVRDLLYVNQSFAVDIVDFTGFYER